jgi:hypothetical protein
LPSGRLWGALRARSYSLSSGESDHSGSGGRRDVMGVGFPASIKLYSIFGRFLSDAFGVTCAYHVGSSLMNKAWRDVDVVVLLEDEDFEKLFGEKTPTGAKWEAYCIAFSALGKDVTGLPVDFKVQPRTWANEKFTHNKEHPDHPRGAMIGGFHRVATSERKGRKHE